LGDVVPRERSALSPERCLPACNLCIGRTLNSWCTRIPAFLSPPQQPSTPCRVIIHNFRIIICVTQLQAPRQVRPSGRHCEVPAHIPGVRSPPEGDPHLMRAARVVAANEHPPSSPRPWMRMISAYPRNPAGAGRSQLHTLAIMQLGRPTCHSRLLNVQSTYLVCISHSRNPALNPNARPRQSFRRSRQKSMSPSRQWFSKVKSADVRAFE